jgi:FKBP-type peptidyl-prolyl cis-trans isomerase FklB
VGLSFRGPTATLETHEACARRNATGVNDGGKPGAPSLKLANCTNVAVQKKIFMLSPTLLLLLLAAAPLALAGTHSEGLKWLEENKAKPGVITLPSGLQYKVLKHGSGVFHPTSNSPCECHYQGTLIDGTEFDSSYKRGEPTTFAPNQVIRNLLSSSSFKTDIPAQSSSFDVLRFSTLTTPLQVIKGWTEAMQLMVEGDKWEM